MEQLILIVHVLAAIGIVGLIMIQQGKGADMGASFGSGASQTLFGSSGSGNALTKGTAILAAVFFATSFGLAVIAKNKFAAAGDVDIPVPAVVESKKTPAEAEVPGDIPQTGAAEAKSAPVDGLDVPADESAQAAASKSAEGAAAEKTPAGGGESTEEKGSDAGDIPQ